MLLKVVLVVILCLSEINNGVESKIENQLLPNDSAFDSSSISQISEILSAGYQHELTRRSLRKTIPKKNTNQSQKRGTDGTSRSSSASNTKTKNVNKPGVPSHSSSPASSSKPKNTKSPVVPFETHGKYPPEVILIHKRRSLADPYLYSDDDPSLVCCLLDYAVKELVNLKYMKLHKRKGLYRYYDMFTITRLLRPTQDKKLNEEDALFITQNGSWKDKEIIMPIYRGGKHVVVLVARIEFKTLHYYDPVDQDRENENTKKDSDEMLEKFLSLLGKRNTEVAINERIGRDGWKVCGAYYTRALPKPNSRDQDIDFGAHALYYIDALLNGSISLATNKNIRMDDYVFIVKSKIADRIGYPDWHIEQAKN